MALNYEELEEELAKMQYWNKLFRIVKAEMVKRGHWKNAPRGKPTISNLKGVGVQLPPGHKK